MHDTGEAEVSFVTPREIEQARIDLASADYRKRAKAVLTIGRAFGATSDIVRIAHEDPSEHVRMMAVVRLGKDHVGELTECLIDPSEKIVCYACAAIGSFGNAVHIAALEPLWADARWRVKFGACEAMFRLGRADGVLENHIHQLWLNEEYLDHEKSILHLRDLDGADRAKGEVGKLTLDELTKGIRRRMLENRV